MTEYSFRLLTGGATLKDGTLYYEGKETARLGDITVFDSGGQVDLGTIKSETVREGYEYLVTVCVNDAFMKDAVYPVYIDPSVYRIDTETQSYGKTIQDAPVYSNNNNANGGNAYNLCGYCGSSLGIGRVLYYLPGLTERDDYDDIAASQINSVTLSLREASGKTGTAKVMSYPFLESWTESAVTRNNVNILNYNSSTTYKSTQSFSSSPNWWTFDLTQTVKAWKNGSFGSGANGIILVNENTDNSAYYRNFLATEYSSSSYRPYITFTYTPTISVSVSSLTLAVDETYHMSATTNPSGVSYTWSSSNTSVATIVSSTGDITAHSAGSADIIATTSTGEYAVCSLNVCARSLTLSRTTMALYLGDSGLPLTATTFPSTDTVSFSFTPSGIISLSGSGKTRTVNAVGVGCATITATSSSGLTATCNVSVFAKSVGLSYTSRTLYVNNSFILNASPYPSTDTVTFSVTPSGKVNLNNSGNSTTVSAISAGTATITATTSGGAVNHCVVTVLSRSLTLSATSQNLYLNQSFNLTATTAPSSDTVSFSVSPSSGIVSISGSGKTRTITATGVGSATITVTSSVGITRQCNITVYPLAEGTYFIQNRQYKKYMQIDDDEGPNYSASGAIMEQWSFDGGDYQKWILSYVGNGYYKIINAKSGLALSVQEDELGSEDEALVQELYDSEYRQQWKITLTSHGSYKIKARSSEAYGSDLVMCVGWFLDEPNGTNIEQQPYVDNTSYKEEWYLYYIEAASSIQCEGQKKSNWCWAASARMFTKNVYPSVSFTQNQAVNYIFGSEINQGGSINDAIAAINYYISNINNASISIAYTTFGNVLSETDLQDYLDSGNVLYITRGLYSDINDSDSRLSGHATVIYGYVKSDNRYWYLVRDPSPVNEGSSYLISYEKLYNGRNPQEWETLDFYVWERAIIIYTPDISSTIRYYFG